MSFVYDVVDNDNELVFSINPECGNLSETLNSSCLNGTMHPFVGPTSTLNFAIMIILYLSIFIFGVFGNLLVIFIILRFPQMRTITNTYLFNLALFDLLYLITIPFFLSTAFHGQWIFGKVVCKLVYGLNSSTVAASVFIITVLSADRYLAVCWPHVRWQLRTERNTRIFCLIVWIISFLISIPIILNSYTVLTRDKEKTTVSCTITWDPGDINEFYIIYSFIISFAIPLPLLTFFYFKVLIKMTNHSHVKSQVQRRKRKVSVMVLSVITVYAVCWLPYWILQMVMVTTDRSFPIIFSYLTILNYINSALNPVLYVFLSENFRNKFFQLNKCGEEKDDPLQVITTANGRNIEDKTKLVTFNRRSKMSERE